MNKFKGYFSAAGAYILWGLLPFFWKAIDSIPALELLSHRILWSFIFLFAIGYLIKGSKRFSQTIKSKRTMLLYSFSGLLLATNWFLYIFAVISNRMVDASLGYFITPLFSISLGIIFLKEKINRLQAIALFLATLGVIYLTIVYGAFPWIGIGLALSFGFYGLIKKTGKLESMTGLKIETFVLFIPALAYLIYRDSLGLGSFGQVDLFQNILLIFTGVVTTAPLLLFGVGSRLIPLSSLGFLQFIAPTLQFLISVLIYNEQFNLTRAIGFSFIWLALIIYIINLVRVNKKISRSRKVITVDKGLI